MADRKFLLTAIAFVGILVGLVLFKNYSRASASQPHVQRFALLDPEMAPEAIRPLVMQGFYILKETKKNAPEYAGDSISCTNCHFNCGNTLGGPNGSISLVGVTHLYPKKLNGNPHYTLQDRINACFEKSLNGKPLPKKSKEMQAIMAYLEWISKDVPAGMPVLWLGIKPLRSHHVPNPENGAKIYSSECAMCHGKNGEGQQRKEDLSYPPLWGPHSFNESAGMNRLSTLSAFVYHNMPFQEPNLTVEEALDVAAFIKKQPKPKLKETED